MNSSAGENVCFPQQMVRKANDFNKVYCQDKNESISYKLLFNTDSLTSLTQITGFVFLAMLL